MTFTWRTSRPRVQLAKCWLIVPFLLSAALLAQQSIPAGTIIPVRVNKSLDSSKAKPGEIFTTTVMQDVPLAGSKISAGSKVIGHVVSAHRGDKKTGGQLSLRFNSIVVSKHRVPLTANLRAIASMMEVAEAQVPIAGPDRGTSEADWTTVQIGGQVVYRGGGPVANGLRSVGVPTAGGILAPALSAAGSRCRAEVDDNDRPQALWLFSSDACGPYGFSDLEIRHAGRSQPIGQIELISHSGNVHVRSGGGMLLRVINSGADGRTHVQQFTERIPQ